MTHDEYQTAKHDVAGIERHWLETGHCTAGSMLWHGDLCRVIREYERLEMEVQNHDDAV